MLVSMRDTTTEEHADRGEGNSKGKGVDPRNWGVLDDEDLDLEEQRAALESFKTARDLASQSESSPEENEPTQRMKEPDIFEQAVLQQKAIDAAVARAEHRLRREYEARLTKLAAQTKGHDAPVRNRAKVPVKDMVDKVVNPLSDRRARKRTPQAMEPVRQVTPKSYIGQALGRIDKESGDDSDGGGSSSSSSSESSESSSSGSDNSKAARKQRKSSKKRSKSKKTMLKPIAPTIYDGAVDSRAFHRFITEGTAYVQDGRVQSKKKVFVLSHFLKGKAHEFYIREVSGDPYHWRLREFFTEMFNYCFPINFRTKQREKLKRCFQNDKTVRDYIYELNELWNMIGDVDEHDRVTRLWTGLSAEIQRELWKKELNPEISTFKEVQAAAEIIEIAHSVPMGRDKRVGQKEKTTSVVSASATAPVRSAHRRRGTSPTQRSRDQPTGQTDRVRGVRLPGKGASRAPTKNNPRRRNDLSLEERERRWAEGRCYICGEAGHISRQCQKSTLVRSDTPNKPPGLPSFGIHVPQDDPERLRQLAEDTETQDVMFLGSVGLFSKETWDLLAKEAHNAYLKRPERHPDEESDASGDEDALIPSRLFRDPVARKARDLLNGVRYQGDGEGLEETPWDDPDRFHVYQLKCGLYQVKDYHRRDGLDKAMTLSLSTLEKPEFQMDQAYWLHVGRKQWPRISKQKLRRTDRQPPMGRPIEERLVWWLQQYIDPPNEDRG